jgi:hypothetical protein
MKIFFDTEFYDVGYRLNVPEDLISIGLVTEGGEELYIENQLCDHEGKTRVAWKEEDKAWMKANVLPKLSRDPKDSFWGSDIASEIRTFVGDEKPEFWAFYGAYDWVFLCKLFGGLLKLPKGWPRLFHELKWYMDANGVEKGMSFCPKQDPATQHHALHDAKWERDVYLWIDANQNSQRTC